MMDDYELPELAGSPKQVKWANDIRADEIGYVERIRTEMDEERAKLGEHRAATGEALESAYQWVLLDPDDAIRRLASVTHARTFIDGRQSDIFRRPHEYPEVRPGDGDGCSALEGVSEKQEAFAERMRPELFATLRDLERRPELRPAARWFRSLMSEVDSAKWFLDTDPSAWFRTARERVTMDREPPAQLTFEIAVSRVDTTHDDGAHIALDHTRWHGLYAVIRKSRVKIGGDGASVTLSMKADIELTDGFAVTAVDAWSFRAEMLNPSGASEPVALTHEWMFGDSQQRVEVSLGDLDLSSKEYAVLRMVRSVKEGLHTRIPHSWIRPARDSERRIIAFPSDHRFFMRGGKPEYIGFGSTREPKWDLMDARKFWEDRANPLPEPGPSQAWVWKELTVDATRCERIARKGRKTSVAIRFPHDHSTYADATVFHPLKMVKAAGEEIVFRAPPEWEWTLVKRDRERLKLSFAELEALLEGWAHTSEYRHGRTVEVSRGGYATSTPAPLDAVDEVDVPAELMEVFA